MSKGKLIAWITAIGIGLWMGTGLIQMLDTVAAKAESSGRLAGIEKRE